MVAISKARHRDALARNRRLLFDIPNCVLLFNSVPPPRGTVLAVLLAPRLFNIEDRVKSGIMENIMYMIVYINYFEPTAGSNESLLGL